VPMIARWPGRIAAGSTSNHVSAQWDVMPTVLELVGAAPATHSDGLSLVPTLLGTGDQPEHATMYWELGRQQAVREGTWKLYRRADAEGEVSTVELFDLATDPGEQHDMATERPGVLARMLELAATERTPSEVFPSVFDEGS